MSDSSNQKNKIVLSDYNYQRDIENRVLMAELSVFEVDVLKEVLDHSLRIPLSDLADILDVTEKKLIPALNKLSHTKLLELHGDTICVDKEMRKYYESQMVKFDDDFEPGMEFLQGLLGKLPMHTLLSWYSIPRSATHIFSSIVENYLLTPKIYERYLGELQFEDSVLKKIAQDVMNAPDYKVLGRTLMEKYSLSREQFEEHMLHLEFNFVCCLGYNRNNDVWEEVVTPFYEWTTYLRFRRDTMPKTIQATDEIQRTHPEDYGFVQDISRVLKAAQQQTVKLTKLNNTHTLSSDNIHCMLPHLKQGNTNTEYVSRLVKTLTTLELAAIKENNLQPIKRAQDWLLKPLHDQTNAIYRHSLSNLCDTSDSFAERDFRETEKSLKLLAKKGWIYFDDYVKGMTSGIGSTDSVILQNKGKKWRYALPSYTDEELDFIKKVLFTGLFDAGLVATGTHKGRLCFAMTAFGHVVFGG
jgi:hypothetical protein